MLSLLCKNLILLLLLCCCGRSGITKVVVYLWAQENQQGRWWNGLCVILKNSAKGKKDPAGPDIQINQQPRRKIKNAEDNRWIPPRDNTFKLNVDAEFDAINNCFGTGTVIRNRNGLGILAGFCKYRGSPEVSTGEALAIRDGILLAMEENLTPFEISSDSKVVVEAFKNNCLPTNDIGLII